MATRKTFIIFGHLVRYVGPLVLAYSILSLGGLVILGQFALAMAVLAPLFIVASLGLRGQVLASNDLDSFAPLLLLRVGALLIATFVGTLVCLWFLPEINLGIWAGVLSFKFAESLLDLGTAWKQKNHQNLESLTQSILGIFSLGFGIAFSLLLDREEFLVLSAGLAMLAYAILIMVSILVDRKKKNPLRRFQYRKVATKGITLGLSFALVSLSASIPQMALFKTQGFVVNGIFSLLGYFILLSEVFANPIAQIWLQNHANSAKQDSVDPARRPWLEIFRRVAWVSFPAAIVLPFGWLILSRLETLPSLSITTYLIVVATMVTVHAFQFAGAYAQVNGLHIRWLVGSIVTTGVSWALVFLIGESINLDWALGINLFVLLARTLSLAKRSSKVVAEQVEGSYVVILSSANGSKNLGDQAMFDALVDSVRTEYPGIRIVTDSFQSDWKPDRDGITHLPPLSSSLRFSTKFFMSKMRLMNLIESSINKVFFTWTLKMRAMAAQRAPRSAHQKRWHQIITGADVVLFAGAGAINSRYATHGIYSWGILSTWARQAKKPVLFFGQGLGPFSSTDWRFTSQWLKEVSYLGVRDLQSFELAKAIDVPLLECQPDWATFFSPTNGDLEFSKQLWIGLGSPRISLTLHRTARTFSEKHYIRLITEMAEVAFDIRTQILLLPNMYGGKSDHDGQFMRGLVSKLPEHLRDTFLSLDIDLTYMQTMAILGFIEFSVTSRYHTAVFASMNSTPSLGVAIDSYWAAKLQAAQQMLNCRVLVQDISAPLLRNEIKSSLENPLSDRSLKDFREPLVKSMKKALENA